MHKPKVLVALFRLPYPVTDGTRYKIMNNLVAGLKKDFDVEFFVINIKKYQKSDIEYLEKNFGKVHLFQHSKIAYGLNSIPAFWNGLPLQAEAFRFRDAELWLNTHKHEYDAFYVHEIRMTEFFIRWNEEEKKKILVDFNDAISMNYRSGHGKGIFLTHLFYQWEGRRVQKYESKVLTSFQHFNIVSPADRSYLLENAGMSEGQVDFKVISHGAPVSGSVALLDEDKLFFMGSLDYESNRDGLNYFIRNIWPGLSKRIPDLELVVIGGGMVLPHWRKKNISFKGFVPNVFEAIKHCKALVAPIRFGGGTPSKVLEAMGYGFPVVTTPEGSSGITGVQSGTHLFSINASHQKGWEETIQKIISDSSLRNIMGQHAKKFILENYSNEASQEAFRTRFNEIIIGTQLF